MDRVHFLKSDYHIEYTMPGNQPKKKGILKGIFLLSILFNLFLIFLISNFWNIFSIPGFWVPDSSLLHDAGDAVSLQSLMILIYLRMISIYNNNIIFHGVIKIYTAARYYYYYTNIRAIVFLRKVY